MRQIICLAAAMCILSSCNLNGKKDCNSFPDDTIYFSSNNYRMNTKFPGLPENKYIIGYINEIYRLENSTGVEYEFENEEYKFNGTAVTNYGPFNEVLGTNTISWTGDCKHSSPKTKQFVCDCNPNMSSFTQQIEVIDTTRLWIKTITLSAQYGNMDFGSKPDVYLLIKNGLEIKSPTKHNYDKASMGNLVWNIDDTITISDQYFNLQIEAWDDDWPTKDENISKNTITASDVANWTTGTHATQQLGSWTFEVVRL